MSSRSRLLLRASLVLWTFVPLPAAALHLEVELLGTDHHANVPFGAAFFGDTGALHLERPLDTPGLPSEGVDGPPLAQAHADDTGTFWVLARTGTIPYDADAISRWGETYVKNGATDKLVADISGGRIRVLHYGGQPGFDLLGRVEFFVFVGDERVVTHTAEIHRPEAGPFRIEDQGDLLAYTSSGTSTQGGSVTVEAHWTLDPVALEIPLDHIAIGEVFDVDYFAFVRVEGAGSETSATAYFRDPVSLDGGITVSADGPTPVSVPEPRAWQLAAIGGLVLIACARRRAPSSSDSIRFSGS